MTIRGIDVSNYQSETYRLEDDGVKFDFVFVKATEGTSYVNPRYTAQLKHGRDYGLVVGHYFYINAFHSVRSQVDYFLSKAQIREGEILALDWEEPNVSSADKDDALKYLKSKKPNNKVLLYCNTDYWKNRDHSSYCADGLWIAEYNGKPGEPSITHPWVFHQFTSTPVIDGKKVHLDESFGLFANKTALRDWAGSPKPVPHYAPYPGATYFKIGRTSKLITEMGRALVRAGWKGYKFGPGPVFTAADKKAVQWFQKKQGWSGPGADGIPGPETWKRLKVAPPK